MRNPDRIPIVIEQLQQTWEKFPDWRLGQLISNVSNFWTEDDEMIENLKRLEANESKKSES